MTDVEVRQESARSPELDLGDIQGFILRGYAMRLTTSTSPSTGNPRPGSRACTDSSPPGAAPTAS